MLINIKSPILRVAVPLFFIAFFIILYSKGLRLGGERMFITHDTSQPARIQQFILNIESGQVPPRIAPEMSYRMGWPLFGMYATFAYWVAYIIYFLTKLDIVDVLRMGYLSALALSLAGAYLFLKRHFSISASILGASIYASSSYLATNVFIRGAYAEIWYIAMLPIALLGMSLAGSKNSSWKHTLFAYFAVGFFMMTHNSLAPLTLLLLVAYAFLQENKKNVFIVIGMGILMSSHFLLPMILQNSYTHAYEISTKLRPDTHFLCAWQLWDSEIGYGASIGGCDDDSMPFNVGKPQIIISFVALLFLIFTIFKSKESRKKYLSAVIFSVWSLSLLFMTLYESSFIWKMFDKQLALLQFPWRFIGVSLIGLAFVTAQSANIFEQVIRNNKRFLQLVPVGIVALSLAILIYQSRYFINDQQTSSTKDYQSFYFSKGAIWDRMSFGYLELIPTSVNVKKYEEFSPYANPSKVPEFYKNENTLPFQIAGESYKIIKNNSFYREVTVEKTTKPIIVNVHAHPSWRVVVNGKDQSSWDYFLSKNTDDLGRPIIKTNSSTKYHVEVYFAQTSLEKVSNLISILSVLLVSIYLFYFKKFRS